MDPQLPLPHSQDWGETAGIGKMAIKGVVYNQENPYIQDLKIRGGIGGEAVNGGAILQLGG